MTEPDCTPNKTTRRLTPKNPLAPELCSAKSRARQPKTTYCSPRSPTCCEPVGVRGDLLRPVRRRSREIHPETLDGETKPQWHPQQMVGSTNFRAGPVIAFMSGNLCYQIEHHLCPDLPSNRYAQIAQRAQAVCATYDLPYATGPLARQHVLTLRTIVKLALPDRFLRAPSDDVPEAASEAKFPGLVKRPGRI